MSLKLVSRKFVSIFVLCMLMFSVFGGSASANGTGQVDVVVTTDKAVYAPGEEVIVSVGLKDIANVASNGLHSIEFSVGFNEDKLDPSNYATYEGMGVYTYKADGYSVGSSIANSNYQVKTPTASQDGYGNIFLHFKVSGISANDLIGTGDVTLFSVKLKVRKQTQGSLLKLEPVLNSVILQKSDSTKVTPGFINPVNATATVTGPSIITDLRLNLSKYFIYVGETSQGIATAEMSDSSEQRITDAGVWTSSNPLVATVDRVGVITATGPGSANISVSYGGFTDWYIIDVGALPTGPASVSGVVWDLKTGSNMPGVTAAVYSGQYNGELGTLIGSTETDSSGKYVINDLAPGDFYLQFSKAGYIPIVVTPNDHTLTAGENQKISTKYMYNTIVNGIVKDEEGKPITDVNVTISGNGYENSYYSDINPPGYFEFLNVPVGDNYVLSFSRIGYVDAQSEPISVEFGYATTGEFVMAKGAPYDTGKLWLDSGEVTINVGGTHQSLIKSIYSDGTKVDRSNAAVWSVDDPLMAKVENGLITGLTRGTTVVHAVYNSRTINIILHIDTAPVGGDGIGGGNDGTTSPAPTPTPAPTSEPKVKMNEQILKDVEKRKEEIMNDLQNNKIKAFSDLPKDNWSHNAVEIATKLGIVTGYKDGTFNGAGKVTRAEFATMLFKALGMKALSVDSFADTQGHWAAEAVTALKDAGVISGYKDGTFHPEGNITRGEMVAMLARILKLNDAASNSKFNDIKGNWAENSINQLAEAGLVSGKGAGNFDPKGTASRSETVVMILRILNECMELNLDL
ncbi:S-layer homology domain-containing protein [Cohnella soli]|uniref:S-layer homology domain-containing protein n=1 Tax=Cohnella soli TaxID=425005 RepID=A0ABW0HUX6_9BACL